jgi:hypothetical protein
MEFIEMDEKIAILNKWKKMLTQNKECFYKYLLIMVIIIISIQW